MTDRLNIRSTVAALALAAIVLAVAACGGSSGSSSSAAPPATSTPTSTPASGGGEVSAAAGKVVFTSNCATCHTLADAGATGSVGPNLDDLKPDEETSRTR